SDDLFLSAGHCKFANNQTVQFDFQNTASGTARTPVSFTVSGVVESQNDGTFDYAIVRLRGFPGREFGHATIAAIDPPAGSLLIEIGHPSGKPKRVATGPLPDYKSPNGANWLRYQIDDNPGSSGSGIMNADGQIVALDTTVGCSTTDKTVGNSAMRMSQVIAHSPTLQALTRSKLAWTNINDNSVSVWRLDAAGNHNDHK